VTAHPSPRLALEHSPDRVRALTAALAAEAGLAGELAGALVRQRLAVAKADVAQVNATVDEVARLLYLLDQSRRRREPLLGSPGGADARAALLAGATPAERAALDAARDALRAAAAQVTRAATINRTVLRRSIEAGQAFLMELFATVSGPATSYAHDDPRDAGPPVPGVLLDRRG
jgi:hypothetical protein